MNASKVTQGGKSQLTRWIQQASQLPGWAPW